MKMKELILCLFLLLSRVRAGRCKTWPSAAWTPITSPKSCSDFLQILGWKMQIPWTPSTLWRQRHIYTAADTTDHSLSDLILQTEWSLEGLCQLAACFLGTSEFVSRVKRLRALGRARRTGLSVVLGPVPRTAPPQTLWSLLKSRSVQSLLRLNPPAILCRSGCILMCA